MGGERLRNERGRAGMNWASRHRPLQDSGNPARCGSRSKANFDYSWRSGDARTVLSDEPLNRQIK